MLYIIMADGKGLRWNNYNDIPKHLITIDGESLLSRTVRLIKEREPEAEIVITSHNPQYEIDGARRYEPKNNVLEIDRFTAELIDDNICFLYGDTFYSEKSMNTIAFAETDEILFFGNGKSIVAVKVTDGELFRKHVNRVRQLYLDRKLDTCKGWQVYQSYAGLPFGDKSPTDCFVFIEDETRDFNSPKDLEG